MQVVAFPLIKSREAVRMFDRLIPKYYNSVHNRDGSGKFAHVSKMHKLVSMIFMMLKEKEGWKYGIPVLTGKSLPRVG